MSQQELMSSQLLAAIVFVNCLPMQRRQAAPAKARERMCRVDGQLLAVRAKAENEHSAEFIFRT